MSSGADVGDVATPPAVRLTGLGGVDAEVAADQVRALRGGWIGDGGLPPAPRCSAVPVGLAHQPCDPFARTSLALGLEFVLQGSSWGKWGSLGGHRFTLAALR